MSTDPDLDTPAEDPPPRAYRPRPYPQPNIWWSLLACVGLLLVQTVGFVVVWLGLWLPWCAAGGGEFGKNTQEDLSAMAPASARPPAVPGEPAPGMSVRMAVSLTSGIVGAFVGMFLYACLLCRLVFGKGWTRTIAFRRPGLAQLLIALLVFLPGLIFTLEFLDTGLRTLTGIRNESYDWMASALTASPVWLGLLAISIGPGVVEEVFCRGFLGRGLVGRHGWVFGAFLTSLLFGVLHLEPIHMLMTMLIGVGLHFTLATSRSLWVPILLHAVNNGLWAVAAALSFTELPSGPVQVSVRFASAAALLGLGARALWACRAKVVPVDENADGWQPKFPTAAAPPADSGLTTAEGRVNPLPLLLAVVPLAGLVYSMIPTG
jgi:membrane protease YdiL (CAAX protease family)